MLCRRWEVQTTCVCTHTLTHSHMLTRVQTYTCSHMHAHTHSHTLTCFLWKLSQTLTSLIKCSKANRKFRLTADRAMQTEIGRQLYLYNLNHYIYFLGLLKHTTKTWFIKTDCTLSLSVLKYLSPTSTLPHLSEGHWDCTSPKTLWKTVAGHL